MIATNFKIALNLAPDDAQPGRLHTIPLPKKIALLFALVLGWRTLKLIVISISFFPFFFGGGGLTVM